VLSRRPVPSWMTVSVGRKRRKPTGNRRSRFVGVQDPLFAYQRLANASSKSFTIPIVAITGATADDDKGYGRQCSGQRWRTLNRRQLQQPYRGASTLLRPRQTSSGCY
jgi:hypothetical protein